MLAQLNPYTYIRAADVASVQVVSFQDAAAAVVRVVTSDGSVYDGNSEPAADAQSRAAKFAADVAAALNPATTTTATA